VLSVDNKIREKEKYLWSGWYGLYIYCFILDDNNPGVSCVTCTYGKYTTYWMFKVFLNNLHVPAYK